MRRSRLFGVVLLVSSFAIGPALASPPPFRWYRIYYAEPALQTVVGEKMYECTGSYMQDGEITPYYQEIWREPCY